MAIELGQTFFSNMYTQSVFWILCVTFAIYFAIQVKKMSFGDDTGSSAWKIIAIALFILGIRVVFKVIVPDYTNSYALQIVRYSLGIIGIILLYIGFLKYQSTLRKLFGVNE